MTNKERLNKLLNIFKDSSKVLIVINADPDAISCAMGLKRLLWRKVAEVGITHFNEIHRPDNLAFIEYTEPGLIPLKKINKSDYDTFVIIDSQPAHSPAFSEFEFDVIIDHHPEGENEASFIDIRSDYGACATIMTEYLKSSKIKPSPKLAAALMLGIKTDTANFTRQTTLKDFRAYQFLFKYAEHNIVTKVERSVLTQDCLDFLWLAIKKRQVLNNRAFYHAGNINIPDQLVIVADFFLTLAKVNWSIISGVCNGNLIIVMRNDGLRKGAGNTASEAFSSLGSAGGHKTMARAEIPYNRLKKEIGSSSQKVLAQWVIDSIENCAGKKTD